MFNLKPVFFQHLIRSAHLNLIRHRHIKEDPGIGYRKKILSLPNDKESELPDFDDLESDFMDVHKSHKEHLRETETVKERTKFLIVRQKYFKEKFPNFLTWHDKEQIRYLYRTDPEEWTIDKLAEGFPALPETIEKIVKSNWTKNKQHKIANHDKSVQKNWELFKNGEMRDLPPDLQEHLNKFTNRALNLNAFVASDIKKQTIQVKTNKFGSEFSEIITSYEKMRKNNVPQIEDKEITMDNKSYSNPPLKETYVASKFTGRKSMVTLDELQKSVQRKVETGQVVDSEETVIVMNLKSQENDIEKVDDKNLDADMQYYQRPNSVQVYKKAKNDLLHLNYPEKINIPKDIFKKGFIYKLNDCYYDDDGEFLYRVPGMD